MSDAPDIRMVSYSDISRAIRTLRYLRPVQVAYLLKYKLTRPRCRKVAKHVELRQPTRAILAFWLPDPPFVTNGRFHFLGESRDHQWFAADYPRLWLYNLHYFDYLRSVSEASPWIADWIRANPCPEGPGWEPYPLSRRIVNWSKWLAEGNRPVEHMLESLSEQAEFLSRRIEVHLLTNHLFANAKALLIAALLLDSSSARRWGEVAERLLWRELDEQFFRDGGHFERSPMYHAVMLEDLLDIVNFGRAYDWAGATAVTRRVPEMLGWLKRLCRHDGQPMHFHDSVGGVASDFQTLSVYASNLDIQIGPTELEDSGYLDLEGDNVRIVMDVGAPSPSYQPGHSHAQALSLEAEIGGMPLFVNAGISTYEPGTLRSQQRSTEAHSTVTIDGENSAEVWAAFRIGRRPRLRSWRGPGSISGEHDGYRHLPGQPTHQRMIYVRACGFVVIDRIEGRGIHTARAVWLLHPAVKVDIEKRRLTVGNSVATLSFVGPIVLDLESVEYWPGFGERQPTKRLVCRYEGPLPVSFSMEVTIASA